ncbi:MAG: HAD family hydrolase [Acidobacteriota bacterium]
MKSGGSAGGASGAATRGILFDAGGTLIHLDGSRICRAAGLDAAAAGFARAEAAAGRALRAWMAENPQATDAERVPRFLDAILLALGLEDPDRRRDAARAVAAEHVRANVWSRAGEGAIETLRELSRRGFRIGVVSNADGRVRALLDAAGFSAFLEVVVDSAEAGFEKPDPRIFHAATGALGLLPADCVYVGDIYEIDVVGARRAGMRAILIGTGEADGDVERIASLAELLEKFPAGPAPD